MIKPDLVSGFFISMSQTICNIYRIKDLYEAAVLHASQIPLLRLEFDQKQAWFIFQDSKECQETSSRYWAETLQVNAKNYADSIKSLKERIFAQRR